MEVEEVMELYETEQVELKYCERCGGLWLRLKGSGQVYCSPCVPKMAELAVARTRGRNPRLPVARDLDLQAVVDEVYAEGALA